MKIFLLLFFLSFITTGIVLPFFKKYNLDIPNSRSSHKQSKPTSAGIVFASYTVIFAILFKNFIPLICFPLALIGFVDDKLNISSKIRYSIQFISVFSLILIHLLQEQSNKLFNINTNSFIYFFLILFLLVLGTAVINFTNFMDGIDGLIGGCMFIVYLSISIKYNPSLLTISGALLGFLLWNWYPSKVFMGDVGSTFLGCLFFGTILASSNLYEFILSLTLISPILLDTITCIIRRLFYRQNIFKAHKQHLYQRLFQAGISPNVISLIYILSTLLLCISYLYFNLIISFFLIFSISILGIWLDRKKAINFQGSLKIN